MRDLTIDDIGKMLDGIPAVRYWNNERQYVVITGVQQKTTVQPHGKYREISYSLFYDGTVYSVTD